MSEPPVFGQPNSAPPEISRDFDGQSLTFRPLVRAGLVGALVPLVAQLGTDLGAVALLLSFATMALLLWLGFVGYEEHMRITMRGVRLETRLAGWPLRSDELSFADIQAVVADSERGSVLRFVCRDRPSKRVRLGTHDDHVKLAAWLTGIVESRPVLEEGSRADVPESLRQLAQVASRVPER